MLISVLNLPEAMPSAVAGVGDLLVLARFAASTRQQRLDLDCQVLDRDAFLKQRPSALGDVLFLPPMLVLPERLVGFTDEHVAVARRLEGIRAAGVTIAACCTAVALAARGGGLDGGAATSTWWAVPLLRERFPAVHFQASATRVEHQGYITSAGPLSWVGQIIHLIERFHGADISRLCAKVAVVEPGRPSSGIFMVPGFADSEDPLVRQLQELIAGDIATGVSVSSLARQLNLSERTLHRRVKEKTGRSPRQLIADARIEIARTLLETTAEPISRVSQAVGFADDSSFRSAFTRAVGATPASYRARMNPDA